MILKQTFKLALIAALVAAPFSADAAQDRISDVDAPAVDSGLGGSCPNGQTVLLDQAPNQINGVFSDIDCDFCNMGAGGTQVVADDFVLAAEATIGQIVFWNGYFPNDQIPASADAVTVIFHSDTAGLPGGVLDTQTIAPTSAVTTGVTLFGVSEIQTVLDIAPVTLPAGTYWVELSIDSTGNTDSMFWEVGDLDATNGRDGTAFAVEFPAATWMPTPMQNTAFTLCAAAPVVAGDAIVAVPTLDTLGLVAMVALLLAVGVFVMSRRRQNV